VAWRLGAWVGRAVRGVWVSACGGGAAARLAGGVLFGSAPVLDARESRREGNNTWVRTRGWWVSRHRLKDPPILALFV
jgi:hypothetical protein